MRKVSHTSGRSAFTLVELLVVIGIIALLVSILLPALNKAKESSRQVKCLSNLKQLANATMGYVNDNKGVMPAAAGGGPLLHVSSPEDLTRGCANFLCWYRIKDPVTGTNWPANAGPANKDMQITDSALAKYLGRGDIDKLEEVFRCPSDNLLVRPNMSPLAGLAKFRYSYSMNVYVSTKANGPKKISSIKNSAQKVLYVCEDELTLDDGLYNPNATAWNTGKINGVAARHRMRPAKARNLTGAGNISSANEDCIGNVGFCDGHAEVFSRKDALRQRYTDSTFVDPSDF